MSYPLNNWNKRKRGSIPFGTRYPAHIKNGGTHLGEDYLAPVGTPIYAPLDGVGTTVWGKDGGNTYLLKTSRGLIRFMHLNEYGSTGIVKENDIIGYVGVTGLTTAPHVHIDISKNGKLELKNFNNFADPETFFSPMKINVLVCVDLKTYNHSLLQSRLGIITQWYRQHGEVEFEFMIKQIHTPNMLWDTADRAEIRSEWLAYRLVPHASGYDACVLWTENWKSTGSRAFSKTDTILGVHCIATGVPEQDTDPRWASRYDGSPFTGVLAHELAHMLRQRSGSYVAVNETNTYKKGMDNTHYFDFIEKDLSGVFKDLNLRNFNGWDENMVFSYAGKPMPQKWAFSGLPRAGKVYRSSDNRMFFKCKTVTNGKPDWVSITDTEYNQYVKSGHEHGTMAVQEANMIQSSIGLPIPEATGTIIREKKVDLVTKLFYLSLGWTSHIPTKHLL